MRSWLPKLVKEKAAKKVCAIYQDDEFGLEVVRGAEEGLKTMGMTMAEKTSFKRGATDFSSQVARMKAAGCDFVVLGTIIRETIGTIGESRKTGFSPTFLGSSAAYTDLIHKLGGKAMDGLYATMTVVSPYLDEASQPVRFWATKYKTKFNEDPTVFSVYGYLVIDIVHPRRAEGRCQPDDRQLHQGHGHDGRAARHLRQRRGHLRPAKRLGSNLSRLSQIRTALEGDQRLRQAVTPGRLRSDGDPVDRGRPAGGLFLGAGPG
jgi:branched-chain amino acid transport system substrate-binding protein